MLLVWQQSIFTGNRVAVEAEGKFLIDFALSSKSDFLNIESHFNIYEVESHTVSVGVTLYHCRSHFVTGIHTNSLKSHTVLLGVTLLSLWDTLFHWKSQYYHWRSHCITEVTLHFWGGHTVSLGITLYHRIHTIITVGHCITGNHTIITGVYTILLQSHCVTGSHTVSLGGHTVSLWVILYHGVPHCTTEKSQCITVGHTVSLGATLLPLCDTVSLGVTGINTVSL